MHNSIPDSDLYNSVPVVALKAHLRGNLPAVQPRIQNVLESTLEQMSRGRRDADGMTYSLCRLSVNTDGFRLA